MVLKKGTWTATHCERRLPFICASKEAFPPAEIEYKLCPIGHEVSSTPNKLTVACAKVSECSSNESKQTTQVALGKMNCRDYFNAAALGKIFSFGNKEVFSRRPLREPAFDDLR